MSDLVLNQGDGNKDANLYYCDDELFGFYCCPSIVHQAKGGGYCRSLDNVNISRAAAEHMHNKPINPFAIYV